MSTVTETDLKTRRSLLSRLRDLDDRESWRTFFDLYWRMLYNVARKSGLAEADAQDVVQETVVARVREQVNPKHFQVFDYCVRQGWPAGKVAKTLGMNIAQVYLARHRVSHAVKAAARAINEERLRGGIASTDPPRS